MQDADLADELRAYADAVRESHGYREATEEWDAEAQRLSDVVRAVEKRITDAFSSLQRERDEALARLTTLLGGLDGRP